MSIDGRQSLRLSFVDVDINHSVSYVVQFIIRRLAAIGISRCRTARAQWRVGDLRLPIVFGRANDDSWGDAALRIVAEEL